MHMKKFGKAAFAVTAASSTTQPFLEQIQLVKNIYHELYLLQKNPQKSRYSIPEGDIFRPEIYGDFQKSPYISGLKMSKKFWFY